MWSPRGSSCRQSNSRNLFINNLPEVIDSKTLFDNFSKFGEILSCKVATTIHGRSKGYGYIHFATEKAALAAIRGVNGMAINGKKIFLE